LLSCVSSRPALIELFWAAGTIFPHSSSGKLAFGRIGRAARAEINDVQISMGLIFRTHDPLARTPIFKSWPSRLLKIRFQETHRLFRFPEARLAQKIMGISRPVAIEWQWGMEFRHMSGCNARYVAQVLIWGKPSHWKHWIVKKLNLQ